MVRDCNVPSEPPRVTARRPTCKPLHGLLDQHAGGPACGRRGTQARADPHHQRRFVEREHRRRGARGDAGEWRERHSAATGHQEPAARREKYAELWLEAAFCFERRGPRAAALRPLASQVGGMSIERPSVGQRAATFGRSGRDTFPSILDRGHGRTCVWTRVRVRGVGVRVRRASVKHARRTSLASLSHSRSPERLECVHEPKELMAI